MFRLLYNIGIHFYGFALCITSFFNRKAFMLQAGQQQTLKFLKEKADPKGGYIWFHAASLGEFEQGRPVMEQIKRENPNAKILLTFFSPSGYEVKKNYSGANLVCYLPLDTSKNAREFIRLVKPMAAVFIKYEFWPNILRRLKNEHVPTYIISAIFRPGQLFFKPYGKGYLKLLKTFKHIFVQDSDSLQLLEKHDIKNVSVCGDTRFDRVVELSQNPKQLPVIEEFTKGHSVIIAGSSWPKDEELLAEYYKNHPEIRLIVVPHEIHTVHLDSIIKLFENDCMLYSSLGANTELTSRCLIVDVIGLLSSIYRYGNVAYIGGGFGVGIHNTLEAAVYGIPVVFGPNYQKFREARELIQHEGGFSVKNYQELKDLFNVLLNYKTAGIKAGNYVKQNAGATQKIIAQMNISRLIEVKD